MPLFASGVLTENLLSWFVARLKKTVKPFIDFGGLSNRQMLDAALICLATAVYFESRGEPFVGQSAVAHVVLNRVDDTRFPDDICSVVKQGPTYSWKPEFPIRNMCQFSYYCDGKSDMPTEEDAWQTAVLAAFGAMTERTYDPTDGATHYHADYVQPEWAEVKYRTVRINDHIFYKWEGYR